MRIDGAALLTEVNAGSVWTGPHHKFARGVALRQQMAETSPVASLVHSDVCIMAAGRARAAWHRAGVPAPPSSEEVLRGAVDLTFLVIH